MKILYYLIIFFSCDLQCLIIESDKFDTILNYIFDKNVFILIDLDKTLLEPKDEIETIKWYNILMHYENKRMHNYFDNFINYLNSSMAKRTRMKLIDPKDINTIKTIQNNQIPIIAFTHRSISLLQATKEQLKSLNLNFLNIAPEKNKLILDLNPGYAFYDSGILFSNLNKKDKTLKAYLKAINFYPKKIIMIDDKLKNLTKVEHVCKQLNIEFIGIHYLFLNEKIRNMKLNKRMLDIS